jgi:hypothetical protein
VVSCVVAVSLSPAQRTALDLVADKFEKNEFWPTGRRLRNGLSQGSVEEKKEVIASLVPEYLAKKGEPPDDRYGLTLNGALTSRNGHVFRQWVGELLDVLKVLAGHSRHFERFTVDDIKRKSDHIAEAFGDGDYTWLDQVIRMAGLCTEPETTPDGGPWLVSEDVVEALRRANNVDDFLASRGVRSGSEDTGGRVDLAGQDIDEVLKLRPKQGDAASFEEVCSRLRECIHRRTSAGSTYRMLVDGPVIGESGKARADVRLRGILRALRDEPPVQSGESAETAWLAQAAKSPQDQFESQAAVLSAIDRGFSLAREARVLVLVARLSSADKWHGVCGRIDVARPGDPLPLEVRPRGNVRVIEERPTRDALLAALAAAMRGEDFVVGGHALSNHGMDSAWRGYRDHDNGVAYGTRWPNVLLCAREFGNRPFVHGPFQADGPTPVFPTLRDVAWAVSSFRPGPGNDVRPQRMQILLWDYRGRIDQLRASGGRLFISVFPPGKAELSLVAAVDGVNGQRTPFVKDAPGEEVIALDEEIIRASVALKRDDDTVVAHSFDLLRDATVRQLGAVDVGLGQFGPTPVLNEDQPMRERGHRPPAAVDAPTGAKRNEPKVKKNVYGERWTTVRTVGEGGQGQVFEVADAQGGPNRILKRLKNINRLKRFADELKAIQSIDHPNVIKLIDHNLEAERPYLVVEKVGDGSLEKHLNAVASDPLRGLQLFEEICAGVRAAHDASIVHRDLKPENILLRDRVGPPVVTDFGICHIENGERLTLTEEAVGPRLYMAPELEDGRADVIQPASDVYSLGKLLWTMLAGKQVFAREKHRAPANDLAQLLQRDSMEHVNRLLDRMIAVSPEDRFPDASAVIGSLRRVIDLITYDYRAVSAKLTQRCRYCGEGTYGIVAKEDGVSVRNFGLGLVGAPNWRVLVCDACGHVELFRIEKATRKDWWSE